jgi:hypothetical protein
MKFYCEHLDTVHLSAREALVVFWGMLKPFESLLPSVHGYSMPIKEISWPIQHSIRTRP